MFRLITCFCFSAILVATAADAKQAITIALRVAANCSENEVVSFYLTNASSKDLEVMMRSLPWAINSFSVRYTGYLVDGGKTVKLKREHIIADYFTSKTINPKSTIVGSLNLNSVFRDLPKMRSSGDVIIYWAFDAVRLTSPLSSWITTESGIILLPKKGFFSTPCGGVIYEPLDSNWSASGPGTAQRKPGS